MNAKQVAELSGLSVRALHHYDEIGLLRPRRNAQNGYREYLEEDLDKLQQILFFRQCGFSLERIKKLPSNPRFDRVKTFELQKKHLMLEKERIEAMLSTLERTLKTLKGEDSMSQEEKFKGFDFSFNPYEEEAKQLWGDETVEKSNDFITSKSDRERKDMEKILDELFRELAEIRDEDPDSHLAQEAIDKMYRVFNESFGHYYTLESFASLGNMYVMDDRFRANIDKYGEGLAEFLSKAMQEYADRQSEG
ncbi:MerR family transcriptional regulator [Mesotoga prima]|uniref:MerR family transcriptional regulator n=1 Tax=Mesotoga prima TaxID=1184387 RepID=UPI002BBDE695|nr:MerR family transcriptional regulator [Mesotoga prima]HUM23083.1 MerR family transcriptional regulator [Mesotoga prima]